MRPAPPAWRLRPRDFSCRDCLAVRGWRRHAAGGGARGLLRMNGARDLSHSRSAELVGREGSSIRDFSDLGFAEETLTPALSRSTGRGRARVESVARGPLPEYRVPGEGGRGLEGVARSPFPEYRARDGAV